MSIRHSERYGRSRSCLTQSLRRTLPNYQVPGRQIIVSRRRRPGVRSRARPRCRSRPRRRCRSSRRSSRRRSCRCRCWRSNRRCRWGRCWCCGRSWCRRWRWTRRRCRQAGQLRNTCVEQERLGSGEGIDRIEIPGRRAAIEDAIGCEHDIRDHGFHRSNRRQHTGNLINQIKIFQSTRGIPARTI
jgi:hypothetical protein